MFSEKFCNKVKYFRNKFLWNISKMQFQKVCLLINISRIGFYTLFSKEKPNIKKDVANQYKHIPYSKKRTQNKKKI